MPRQSRVRFAALIGATAALLSIPAGPLWARGGLQWGYVNQQQGYPLMNLWLQTSPWSQASGWGIPNRGVGSSGLAPQTASSGPTRGNPGNSIRRGPTTATIGRSPNAGGPTVVYIQAPPPFSFEEASKDQEPRPAPNAQRFEPPYFANYNEYWRSGYWGGGQWGWSRWGGDEGRMIFPRWSAGWLYYQSGYGAYQNPFAAAMPAGGHKSLNYSAPLIPPFDERLSSLDPSQNLGARDDRLRSPAVSAGLKALDAARAAFAEKKYDEALKRTDQALEEMPRDPAVHEFRALVLFAQGEYRQAAAAIYAVLSVSPGWDWATLNSFYSDPAELTRQLRQLEAFRKQNPDSPEAALLLGYHYVTCRHVEAAQRQFKTAARLLPDDRLLPPLVALTAGAVEHNSKEIPSPPDNSAAPPAAAEPPVLDPAKLVGTWKAQRGPVHVALTIEEGGKFTWIVTEAGATRKIVGSSVVEESLLQLESREFRLLGRVTWRDRGGFNFNLSVDDPSDPGLEFAK